MGGVDEIISLTLSRAEPLTRGHEVKVEIEKICRCAGR